MRKNNIDANNNQRNTRSVSTKDGLLYLLVGGGIGATIALLFAPKAGSELRTDITDMSRRGLDQTKEMAQNLKEQSSGLLGSVKEKAGSVYETAASKMGGTQPTDGENTTSSNAGKPNGQLLEITDHTGGTSAGGRKASPNIV